MKSLRSFPSLTSVLRLHNLFPNFPFSIRFGKIYALDVRLWVEFYYLIADERHIEYRLKTSILLYVKKLVSNV